MRDPESDDDRDAKGDGDETDGARVHAISRCRRSGCPRCARQNMVRNCGVGASGNCERAARGISQRLEPGNGVGHRCAEFRVQLGLQFGGLFLQGYLNVRERIVYSCHRFGGNRHLP